MNEKTPEISVIVPVYNAEKYVKRCLDSLVDQDFKRGYEIVVINDGSTDSSLEIVERLAALYKNIRVFSQKNSGLSAARNAGIARARGKYLMFTDSDDYVGREYLSAMYRASEQSGADITCCNYRNVFEGSNFSMGCIFRHRPGVFDSEKMIRALIVDITMRAYAWNKIYRRELFTKHGVTYPEGKYFEDVATTPKLFFYAKKIAVIQDELYNYVQRKGSITGTMNLKKVFDYVDSYADLREFLDEKKVFGKYAAEFYYLGVKIALTALPMLVNCKRGDPKTDLLKVSSEALERLYRTAVIGSRTAAKNKNVVKLVTLDLPPLPKCLKPAMKGTPRKAKGGA